MTTITIERATLDRLIDAWDSTVLPKSRDGMMQERMEDLRAALAAPAAAPEPICTKCGDVITAHDPGLCGCCLSTRDTTTPVQPYWHDAPTDAADHQVRFDAFREALDALCTSHSIQLCTSPYDGLQAWPLRPGEDPVYVSEFENWL